MSRSTASSWMWMVFIPILGIGWIAPRVAWAGEYAIAIGDTISDGVPGVGAGRLAGAKEDDVYKFTASAGQVAFFETLSQDPAFKKNLRWQLNKPGGGFIFGSYFSSQIGRTLLPESGIYTIRVFLDGTDPTWIGPYAFRVTAIPPDQTFPYAVGNSVSDGVPAAGAGRIEVGGAEDNFLLTATAGQLVFFESQSQASAFKSSLRWRLVKPSGSAVFDSYFINQWGRVLLPESGQYRIRVYTDGTDSTMFGDYSFRTYSIPPDQSFAYAVGNSVSDGVPAAGAGRIEVGGAEDNFLLTATAGQLVFFESQSQASAFKSSLRWRLVKPSGSAVFDSYFINQWGRVLLPEAGQYRIRVYTAGTDSAMFGDYSFRTHSIPPDQSFAYAIGTEVSDGVPAVGAGRLEVAGSEESYLFTATAGQVVFFESLGQAASFRSSLRWQLLKPSGGTIFSSYFVNLQGRTVLPEAGQYRLRIFTETDPGFSGTYSFRTRGDLVDQQFTLGVGDVVSDGRPAMGAGNIETSGSTDTYTLTARSGQSVVFESLTQAASLQGALRWQLFKPSGGTVFSSFFSSQPGRILLPEAGVYRLRLFTDNGATLSGVYSFHSYSPVTAYPDFIPTGPNESVTIPVAKLLFNDESEDALDVLRIELPATATSQGGTVTLGPNGILYTPKTGFTGADHFDYRVLGSLGGTNRTTVNVGVAADSGMFAGVVNWVRRSVDTLDANLLGDSGKEYALETSENLTSWIETGTVTAPASGFIIYSFTRTSGTHPLFLRARRK